MKVPYRILVLTLLIFVSECRDLTSASPTAPQAEVKGQSRSGDGPDTSQEPGSSRVKPGRSPEEDGLREFAQIRRKLEEMDSERPHFRQSLPIPGGRTESMARQTRANFLNLLELYLPLPTVANPACRRDLLAILLAMVDLKNPFNFWAMNLVDSWGKLPDGMFIGNVKAYGFFHECLNIRVNQPQNASTELQSTSIPPPYLHFNLHEPHQTLLYPEQYVYDQEDGVQKISRLQDTLLFADDHKKLVSMAAFVDSSDFEDLESSNDTVDFEGQYCLLGYTVNTTRTRGLGDGLRMPGVSISLPLNQQLLSFMAYGTCMPSTCTPTELQESVNAALKADGLKAAYVMCQTASTHHPSTPLRLLACVWSWKLLCVLVSVLCGLLLLATLADLATSSQRWQHCRTGALKYLLTFSVPGNITKLFYLDTKPSSQVISPMYGVRFLSMLWVVLGHQFGFSVTLSQNIGELPKLTDSVLFQLIGNADKSVDTFFLMSGLLVTLGMLTQVTRKGRFSPLLYYVHRIVRLLPPLALTVVLVACLLSLVVSGPLTPSLEPSLLRWCRHNWWMDVTLLFNLFSPHMAKLGPEYGGMACLPHAWYVDVDMQLFIFMPLFLLPLYYKPKMGRVWLVVVTLVSLAIPAIIIGVDDLWPTNMIIADQSKSVEYNQKVYVMPWTRASSYLVGAWVGYLIYLARCDPSIARLRRWQVWAGWGISTGTALAVLFGIARYNHVSLTGTVPIMSQTEAVIYGGLHRAAWAAAVGWVLLACHWGYGGPVNWILSHPLWQPLSRLTYTIYLTSIPVQTAIFYSTQRTTYFTIYLKIQETCGVMLVVLGVSLWVTLVSESPILRIEKLLLTPKDQPSPSETNTDQATGTAGQSEVRIGKGESSDEEEEEEQPEDEIEASVASSGSKELYGGYKRL